MYATPLPRSEWSLLLHAVVDDLMIPLAAYTAAETLNAFQLVRQPHKLPLPVGDLDPILYMVPWAHASRAPSQTASQSVQPFVQG